MVEIKIIVVFVFCVQLSMAQTIDFNLVKYDGLTFHATYSEIILKLGLPEKSYDPNYECGYLSTESQDGKYMTLDYGSVLFTGNTKELYILDEVDFGNDSSLIVKYGQYELSCETDLSELIEIFGKEVYQNLTQSKNGGILIYQENGDDGIQFEILNGKLVRFGYWSPC